MLFQIELIFWGQPVIWSHSLKPDCTYNVRNVYEKCECMFKGGIYIYSKEECILKGSNRGTADTQIYNITSYFISHAVNETFQIYLRL
jgi:hypothetical protein